MAVVPPPSGNQFPYIIKKSNENETFDTYIIIESYDSRKLRFHLGETLLHTAVKQGNVELIKLLIEAGFDVNAQNHLGKTPIMLAIENKPPNFFQVIQIICKAHVNIHIIDKFCKSAEELVLGDPTFINAEENAFVHKLFLNIISRECMNDSQVIAQKLINLRYPLWQAVLLGNAKVIEHMIMHGCPVNSYHPHKKFTCLSKAVECMNFEIVEVLIKYGADVDLADRMGLLPIAHYGSYDLCKFQQPEIIKVLLNKTVVLKDLHQKNVANQFRKVFEYGNKEVIHILLEHYNDILLIRDVQGRTPLHYLSGNPHSDITELIHGREISVNVKDAGGRTPLHVAIKYPNSHINTYRFLLENNVDVNARSDFEDQDVPLFILCYNLSLSKEKYFEIITLFLEYGLNVQYVGLNQTTVFDCIKKTGLFYRAEPLLAHLAILEHQKKPITVHVYNKIISDQIFQNYFIFCKAELEKMKNDIINKNLTLYTVLINRTSEEKILKCCKLYPQALSKFKKLEKKFYPIDYYYAIIRKRIPLIVSKLELAQKAATIICKLLKLRYDLNHLVVTEIISYLDSKDLQSLVEAEI